MNTAQYTTDQIRLLPTQPGVYRFYDAEGILIYVGKAKHLKKRVSSYFSKAVHQDLKTARMVTQVAKIEITVLNSEYEALLLENNLIKQYQPRYNILLRDSKTYPYICITNERFPRVISSRELDPAKGTFFGPFTNVQNMHQILDLIKTLYPLRTCKYHLSEANIQKKKFKVCLDYHIGTCKAPCVGKQEEADYQHNIDQIIHLLKGNFQEVKRSLKQRMQEAAEALDFEEAQDFKDKLTALQQYQAKSLVTNPKWGDLDVFGFLEDENQVYVSYLSINQGILLFAQTLSIQKKLQEAITSIAPLVVCNLRERHRSRAKEVIVNVVLDSVLEGAKVTIPRVGDKKKLVELALKNAYHLKRERLAQKEKLRTQVPAKLHQLKEDLRLKELPLHIECFDNSNILGQHPVAAMVCFKQGKPFKSDYRHFHIKTVEGPDDFASMKEVVWRRYNRLLEEDEPLPNLILIDGGKGQLNAAVEVLKELGVYGKVAIISIAKRLEELYYPGDPYPLHLSKKSPSLKLIQQIRNEAHRFAIIFHRSTRDKQFIQSQLDNIPGVGPKTVEALLKRFGSVQKIRAASQEELTNLVGSAKAKRITSFWVDTSE